MTRTVPLYSKTLINSALGPASGSCSRKMQNHEHRPLFHNGIFHGGRRIKEKAAFHKARERFKYNRVIQILSHLSNASRQQQQHEE